MKKQTLIEIQSTPASSALRVVESDSTRLRKGVLATLEGVFSETEAETQNGRAYSNELWRIQLESAELRSRMENNMLLGEADHPEGLETSIVRVSHVITDMTLKEDENILWGKLDVLDTPAGRIVKTLIDYGWKPGISSRGAGEIMSSRGRQEINPETYEYIVHDLVVDPACMNAHLESVSESKGHKIPLREALIRLAEKDADHYKQEGQEQHYKQLFESKFGIDLSDPKKVVESDTRESILEKKITELGNAVTGLYAQLEASNNKGTLSERANQALVESYRTAVQLSEKLEVELLSYKEKNKIKSSELKTLQAELDTIQESSRSRIDSLTKKAAASARRVVGIQEELRKVQKEAVAKKEASTALDSRFSALQRKVKRLESRNTYLEAKLEEAAKVSVSPRKDESNTITESNVTGGKPEKKEPRRVPVRENRVVENKPRKRAGSVKASVTPESKERRIPRGSVKLSATTEQIARIVEKVSRT